MSAARSRAPSLRLERQLQRAGCPVLAGMDEVGRGALAGPVSVGVVVIDPACRTAPAGVRDSKLLAPHRREQLVAPIRRWALAWGVGHAGADEIDAVGIMGGLRLAGRRALTAAGVAPDLVILDGNHDWLTEPARVGLFAEMDAPDAAGREGASERGGVGARDDTPPVHTVVKGDMRCSSVAAASVLAKVERDALMVGLHERFPAYGWNGNKGYAAPEHRRALLDLGACELHRRSWNLMAAPQHSGAADPSPDPGQGCDMMGSDELVKVGVR